MPIVNALFCFLFHFVLSRYWLYEWVQFQSVKIYEGFTLILKFLSLCVILNFQNESILT